MVNIEEINKRLDGARHYVTCPKARNECKQCDDWFYSATNVQSIIRSLVTDIDSLMNSRDDIIRERNKLRETNGDLLRQLALASEGRTANRLECDKITAELDELRTRHARLVDSTDAFVAALVDERFKKDHATMVAELSGYRAHSADVASTRANIDAILRTNAIELSPDNKSYASKTFAIDRAIHNLRDECRKHLARINQLESLMAAINAESAQYRQEAHALRNHPSPIPMILHCPSCNARHIDASEYATRPHRTHACQSCGTVWRPAIVATVGVQFLPGFKDATTLPANESTGQDVANVDDKSKDATSADAVPDDVLRRAVDWANQKTGIGYTSHDMTSARVAIAQTFRDSDWCIRIREFVKIWREGQAPDGGPNEGADRIGVGDIGSMSQSICTCPPTSEYDDPCPRHGVVGLGFTKYSHIP